MGAAEFAGAGWGDMGCVCGGCRVGCPSGGAGAGTGAWMGQGGRTSCSGSGSALWLPLLGLGLPAQPLPPPPPKAHRYTPHARPCGSRARIAYRPAINGLTDKESPLPWVAAAHCRTTPDHGRPSLPSTVLSSRAGRSGWRCRPPPPSRQGPQAAGGRPDRPARASTSHAPRRQSRPGPGHRRRGPQQQAAATPAASSCGTSTGDC